MRARLNLGGGAEIDMSEVTLREYRSGDWEAMYALDLICFEPPFRFSRRTMRGFAEAPNATALLVEDQGKLVAFCVTHVEQGVGYVVTLDVVPEWRRKGLAARLMAESEARARSAGTASMALHVFTDNSSAVRFYEALAYEQIGLAEDFYGRGLDAFVYVKKLTESDGE
jgi:ribosomal-protein-alanine N-acetyltransferase